MNKMPQDLKDTTKHHLHGISLAQKKAQPKSLPTLIKVMQITQSQYLSARELPLTKIHTGPGSIT